MLRNQTVNINAKGSILRFLKYLLKFYGIAIGMCRTWIQYLLHVHQLSEYPLP